MVGASARRTQAAHWTGWVLRFALGSAPAWAGTIQGTVTDRTTGAPAAGDVVALISFSNGMQVSATTLADSAGRYTLDASAGSGAHLVRVTHQRATYFQPVPQGARTVDVDVFDVAPQVDGIVTEADVLSMQAASGSGALEVREDFFVRNNSTPPRTQFSDRAYEIYLPEGARVEGAAAMGPGGAPVDATPVPLPGAGHFAFVFPVRPGQTRFQITYNLSYTGKTLGWTQREALPTENLVVLLPRSMRFAPNGTAWQSVRANGQAQVFVRKGVAAGAPVAFGVSGQGELPRDAAEQASGQGEGTPKPGGGLGTPEGTPDPLQRWKGWLLGGLGLLLAGGAALLLRGSHGPAGTAVPVSLRDALREARTALERERNDLSTDEYEETRAALEQAMHRALEREAATLAE